MGPLPEASEEWIVKMLAGTSELPQLRLAAALRLTPERLTEILQKSNADLPS